MVIFISEAVVICNTHVPWNLVMQFQITLVKNILMGEISIHNCHFKSVCSILFRTRKSSWLTATGIPPATYPVRGVSCQRRVPLSWSCRWGGGCPCLGRTPCPGRVTHPPPPRTGLEGTPPPPPGK